MQQGLQLPHGHIVDGRLGVGHHDHLAGPSEQLPGQGDHPQHRVRACISHRCGNSEGLAPWCQARSQAVVTAWLMTRGAVITLLNDLWEQCRHRVVLSAVWASMSWLAAGEAYADTQVGRGACMQAGPVHDIKGPRCVAVMLTKQVT